MSTLMTEDSTILIDRRCEKRSPIREGKPGLLGCSGVAASSSRSASGRRGTNRRDCVARDIQERVELLRLDPEWRHEDDDVTEGPENCSPAPCLKAYPVPYPLLNGIGPVCRHVLDELDPHHES